MSELLLSILLFNGVMMTLVLVILVARRVIVGSGTASVGVEGFGVLPAPFGVKLLGILTGAGLPVPSTCGGRGTCGLCRVRVSGQVGPPLGTELSLLDAAEVARGVRLACQVPVRGDLEVALPDGLPSASSFPARVRSSRNLTLLIKEIILEVPAGTRFEFQAGSFVQVTCPSYQQSLAELPIDESFRAEWAQHPGSRLLAGCSGPTTRAYSLANHPGEPNIAMLVVRLALPPPGPPPGAPPGVVSSYLFGLQPGDQASLSGPFGHFVASDSDREMIFVGGGAGMAPMRAHVFEQLEVRRTQRKVSFWYGARSRRDLFYVEEFDRLEALHPNFRWSVALSEPSADDAWKGATGFIHEHLRQSYLAEHPAPQDCEYYLCGPPLMVRAVVAMLDGLGVDRAHVHHDDFGG